MLFSAFAPFGMLEFSGELSEGEKIYKAMVGAYTDPTTGKPAIDLSQGTHHQAKTYATAMAIAAARVTVKRARNQIQPATSFELLSAHANRYGVSRAPGQTLPAFRSLVAAQKKILRGARHEAIVEGLSAILGPALIAYRVLRFNESFPWPTMPGASTDPGIFTRPDLPAKTVKILDPITPPSFAPITVSYTNWNDNEPEVRLSAGDVICVQAESDGNEERVVVQTSDGEGDERTITAIFAKPHDENCSATTGPVPIWTSQRRFVLVVGTREATKDPELRRQVNAFMARISRNVTQWAFVHPTTPGADTIGPFTLDDSELGAVTVGDVDGITLASIGTGGVDPPIPPEPSVPWTIWQRDYVVPVSGGQNWDGVPSSGPSGSRYFYNTGYPTPGVGTLNGHAYAQFTGSQILAPSVTDHRIFGVGSTSSDAATGLVVFRAPAYGSDPGSGNRAGIWCDTAGGVQICLSSSGCNIRFDDTLFTHNFTLPYTPNVWQCVRWRWNQSTIDARITGGSWVSQALFSAPSGHMILINDTDRIGSNFSASAFLVADVAEYRATNITLPDADVDAVIAALSYRYAVPLL